MLSYCNTVRWIILNFWQNFFKCSVHRKHSFIMLYILWKLEIAQNKELQKLIYTYWAIISKFTTIYLRKYTVKLFKTLETVSSDVNRPFIIFLPNKLDLLQIQKVRGCILRESNNFRESFQPCYSLNWNFLHFAWILQ